MLGLGIAILGRPETGPPPEPVLLLTSDGADLLTAENDTIEINE